MPPTPLTDRRTCPAGRATGLPLLSFNVSCKAALARPSATIVAGVTVNAEVATCGLPARNVVFTCALCPFTVAVTVLTPARRFFRVAATSPLSFVVTCATDSTAPFVALRSTLIPLTGLPCASVTTAFTALVLFPSARALSRTTVRLPSAICAVPLSATNRMVVAAALPLLFSTAFTATAPARVLARSAVA